ncbi:MAG: leucine-rich repeat protein [Clostridia bacterium]|nr:leucine-rich repeat protein [Clostridia bacterium]
MAMLTTIMVACSKKGKTFSVTFYVDGNEYRTYIVNEGSALDTIPDVPSKEGYEASWSVKDDSFDEILTDLKVYAVYNKATYTILFLADGIYVSSITLNNNERITESKIPEIPPKEGFTGEWNITDFSKVKTNIVVEAVYSPIVYYVQFVDKNGRAIGNQQKIVSGSIETVPKCPEENGLMCKWVYQKDDTIYDFKNDGLENINLVVRPYYYPRITFHVDTVVAYKDYEINEEINSLSSPQGLQMKLSNEFDDLDFYDWYYEESFLNRVQFPLVIENNIDVYGRFFGSIETEGLVYENGIVTGYTGTATEVFIPYSYTNSNEEKVRITQIAKDSFKGKNITKIHIPATCLTIGEEAFCDCSNLQEVIFDYGTDLENLGVGCFKNCSSLKGFEFSENITNISEYAFYNCVNLVTLKGMQNADISEVGDYAFYNCSSVNNISLGLSIETIGNYAFYNNISASFSIVAYNLSEIGDYAFFKCKKLGDLYTTSSKLTRLGENIFTGCENITSTFITNRPIFTFFGGDFDGSSNDKFQPIRYEDKDYYIPISLTEIEVCTDESNQSSSIPENFLYNCKYIKKVIIGSDITKIDNRAFFMDVTATSAPLYLIIPDSLTEIGDYAFVGRKDCNNINLPSGLTKIGEYAFYGCNNLFNVTYSGTGLQSIGKYAFKNTGYYDSSTKVLRLGYVVVGISSNECEKNNITYLGKQDFGNATTIMACAFEGNTTLKTIDLGNNITIIEDGAFKNCSSIETFIFNKNNSYPLKRSFGEYILEGCNSLTNLTLYEDIPIKDELNDLSQIVRYSIIDIFPNTLKHLTFKYVGENSEISELPVKLDSLETIVIDEGFTTINDNAFKEYENLKGVIINDPNLQTIGKSAFEGCIRLTSIDLENAIGLIKIDDNAFLNCQISGIIYFPDALKEIGKNSFKNSNITSLYCNDDLETIGDSAFEGCERLENVVINSNIHSIGKYAFKDTSISVLKLYQYYNDGNEKQSIEYGEGILRGTALNKLQLEGSINVSNLFKVTGDLDGVIKYPINFATIDVLSGEIIDNAFDGVSTIQDVTIRNGVTRIGNFALRDCTSLKNINIPASTIEIGIGAFKNCSNMINCNISTNNSQMVKLGNGAFYNCKKLSILRLPNTISNDEEYEEIPSDLDIDIEEGYDFKQVFYGCEKIVTLNVPILITEIGDSCFAGCEELLYLSLSNDISSIGQDAFLNCQKVDFDTVTFKKLLYIGDNAFESCSQLHSLVAENLVTLGENVYKDCINIEKITILNGNIETYINVNVCTALKSLDITGTNIESLAAYDTLETVYITNKEFNFSESLFNENTIVFLNKTTYAQNQATLQNSDHIFEYPTSVIFNYEITSQDNKTVIITGINSGFTPYIYLPETVVINSKDYSIVGIGNNAFKGQTGLKYIHISLNVETIGDSAFENCTNLKMVDTMNGGKLKTIGVDSFKATGIEDISLPSTLVSIGNSAFQGCSSLNRVLFFKGSELTTVGNSVFEGCINLETVKFTSNLSSLGDSCFKGCESLINFEFGPKVSLSIISDETFSQCSSLAFIELPDSLITIGDSAFESSGLEILTIPNNVVTIGDSAFYSSEQLTDIMIGASLKVIGDKAFYNASNITFMMIPDSVTTIGDDAFMLCSNLTTVSLGENLTTLGENAFMDNHNLESVFISSKYITTKNENIFSGANEALEVIFSDSVMVVPDYLFKNNSSLASVKFFHDTPSLMYIGEEAFYNCSNLTEVYIPCTVLSIGDRAFASNNLTKIEYEQRNSKRLGIDWYGTTPVVVYGANNKTIDDYYYVEYGNKIYLTGYLGDETTINIPSVLGEKQVVAFCSTFEGDTTLEQVNIPDSITQLGSFYDCTNLTRIHLGSGITSILENTFYNCTNLSAIIINDSISLIDDGAFNNCTNLKLVYFDNNLLPSRIENEDSLGGILKYADSVYVRKDVDVSSYIYDEDEQDNNHYSVIKNAVSGYDVYTNLYFKFSNNNAYAYLISDDYESGTYKLTISGIGATDSYDTTQQIVWKDYLEFITIVNIDREIRQLGKNVLSGLSNLQTLNANFESLEDLNSSNTITDSKTGKNNKFVLNIECNVLSLPAYFMYNATNLKDIRLANGAKVNKYGNYAFYGCTSLTSIIVSDTITEVGNNCFYNCKAETITLGQNLQIIGNKAFGENSNLKKIILNSKNINNLSKESEIFLRPNTQIENKFELVINNTVISIPSYFIYSCSHLNSIDFSNATKLESIGDSAFYKCALSSIDLPLSLVSIGQESFMDNSYLSNIMIKNNANLSRIGKMAFSGTMFVNTIKNWSDGLLYIRVNNRAYLLGYNLDDFSNKNQNGDLVLDKDTYLVAENVFENALNLSYITVPEKVRYINNNAFYGCQNIIGVFIKSSLVVPNINEEDDYGCLLKYTPSVYVQQTILDNVINNIKEGSYFNSAYTKIANTKKYGSINYIIYTKLYWETSATGLDRTYAYLVNNYSDDDIKSYTLIFNGVGNMKKSLDTIPWSDYIAKITTLYVGATISNIPNRALANASSLSNIQLSDGAILRELGDYAFTNCSSLETVKLITSISKIGTMCFSECVNLETVEFYAEECADLGINTFSNAGKDVATGMVLKIYTSVKRIPANFMNSDEESYCNLKKVLFENYQSTTVMGFDSIGKSAFENCINLELFDMESKEFLLKSIKERAFYNCNNLNRICITANVESIEKNAFAECDNLADVKILSLNLSEVDPNATLFVGSGSTAGLSVTLPNGGTKLVPNYFMKGANYLSEIKFSSGTSCETIGIGAFEDCINLKKVSIPHEIKTINKGAFSGCYSLNEYEAPFVGGLAEQVGSSESTLLGFVFGSTQKEKSTRVEQEYNASGQKLVSYIPNSLSIVTITYYTNVYYGAFQNCSNISKIEIKSSTSAPSPITKGSISIGNGSLVATKSFYGCSKLNTLILSEQLLTIEDNACEYCTSLTEITIPQYVTNIGIGAFKNCRSISKMKFNAENCSDFSMNNEIFTNVGQDKSGLSLEIGESVTRIPNYFFCPNDVTTNTTKSPKTNEITFKGNRCTKIGRSAFRYNEALSNIYLPTSVTSIGQLAFASTGYYNASSNWLNSLLYIKDNSSNPTDMFLIKYDGIESNITIKSSVVLIADDAFSAIVAPNSSTNDSKNKNLKTVLIGENVVRIGNRAFYNCDELYEVKFNGNAVEYIGEYAFYGCSILGKGDDTEIFTITGNVTTIGRDAFTGCMELKTVKIDSELIARNLVGLEVTCVGGILNYVKKIYFSTSYSIENIGSYIAGNFDQSGNDPDGYNIFTKKQ